ncbi:MAG: pitrilysin family protein [Pseudomonadota bacterium]
MQARTLKRAAGGLAAAICLIVGVFLMIGQSTLGTAAEKQVAQSAEGGGERFVNVQQVTSPGGIEAWLVEDKTNPIIAMEFAFNHGAAKDPEGKTGLAFFLSGMLDEGAGDLDATAFQEALKAQSIGLSYDADRDSFFGSFRTLKKYSDDAFELLRLSLNEPRFDDAAFEKVRSQINVILAREQQDPSAIARNAIFSTVFDGHPYGLPVRGTPETVAGLTPDDLRTHHKALMVQDGLKVSVVGDITAEELAPLLDRVFGGLPETGPLERVPDQPAPAQGSETVIPRDNPQSVVLFLGPGLLRDDEDFIPAYVLNYILGGGGFSSRLMDEVREKRGLAYSVVSYLYPLRRSGMFLGNVATRNDAVRESMTLIQTELDRIKAEGVTDAELDDAKAYLTGSYPLRFDTGAKIAGQMIGLQINGFEPDYFDDRNALIRAVTGDDLKRVAARFPSGDQLTVVIVGDPDEAS